MKPQSGKRSSEKDANFLLPHDLLPLIREHLDRLPPTPRGDWLKTQVFTKFVSSETAPAEVRRNSAIRKWLAAERNNEATNVRLMTVDEEYNILPRVTYGQFLDRVQEYVRSILGDVPPVDVLYGTFSGGATTSRPRAEGHPARKYLGKADVTMRAQEWANEALSSSPLWCELRNGLQFSVVEGNKLFTVAKTTDIDRVACKEPDINMYLQKGVGDFIRRRLRRVGINLNDQTNNQRLARKGASTGAFATIDLSSASDSVTTELVFQCVPISWYTLLDSLRCHVTIVDGEEHVNEMFSSMGNGFTFELESLLFWAIAKAVAWFNRCERMPLLVYGDDIIVPSAIADQLIFALSFLGFTTNEDKTFSSGPFRESCGGHYYNDDDITPFYIKAPLLRLTDVIHLCNRIRKWSDRGWSILSDDLEELWMELSKHVPKCFWGGFDLESDFQLVSYWWPKKPKRLVPIHGNEICLGDGGYLLWLNSAERRKHRHFDDDPLHASSEQKTYKACASKRVFHDRRWRGSAFLHEVHPPTTDATSVAG